MKTTNALSARMRQLLANLHPPSPPTAREGQQLLNVLQSSFKRQLDAEHPNPLQSNLKDAEHHAIPATRESATSHATTSYFGSILAHPVLGTLEGLRTKQDAIAKFDRLVAESQVDSERLAGLIKWYNRETLVTGTVHDGETLGTRLNAWLHSTDTAAREQFFLNESTLKAALEMLIAENNEATIWNWLRMVYERQLIKATLKSQAWLHVEDRLVSSLMRMAILRNDLNEAAQQFNQACQYRLTSGRANPATTSQNKLTKLPSNPLYISGRRLASSIIFYRHGHNIDTDSFSTLLDHVPSWTASPECSRFFIKLYHPTLPSARSLFYHLKDGQADQLIQRQRSASKTSRKAVMTAILDASKLSLDQGSRAQATFLLDFAIHNYPDFLPPREVEEVEPQLELSFNFAPG